MPAHQKVPDASVEPIAPATITAGSGRVDRCPKCGARISIVDQEPCFSRCRMCGTMTPVRGSVIAEQMKFERSSGLAVHKVEWSEGRPLFHARHKGNGHSPSA